MLKNWKGDVSLSGIPCRNYIEFHCQTMIAVWEQSQQSLFLTLEENHGQQGRRKR